MSELVSIPASINGVVITFADTVNRMVHPRIVECLSHIVERHPLEGVTVRTLHISSASDSHEWPSRHAQAKAVDISRVNGKKMFDSLYDTDVYFATQRLQYRFEEFLGRRESYGPFMRLKCGQDNLKIQGHGDHIHFSVD